MPTAVINHPHATVRLENQTLTVWVQSDADSQPRLEREIPLRDLERVVLGHTVHVSGPAMSALLQAGVPIQIFAWNGRFLGGFLPAQSHHGLSRLRQYQRAMDPAFCHHIAGRLVTAKLYNQRRMLQRLGASRGWLKGPEAGGVPTGRDRAGGEAAATALRADLAWLDGRFQDVAKAASIDELRGHEGVCTARYFLAWARFLPAEFPFTGRTTRPPLDPVNACISFGATLLYSEAVAFCHAHGLDPALGTLHSTTDGRWSLALDLIEPFRPVLVEPLALDLFSHQILNRDHFEYRDPGVFLNAEGRRRFFLQYERRMERQFMSESVGHRTTLRQQLEQQAVMFKAALEEPARFEPFLVN